MGMFYFSPHKIKAHVSHTSALYLLNYAYAILISEGAYIIFRSTIAFDVLRERKKERKRVEE